MTEKETPIVTALTQIGSELKRLNDFAAAYLKAAATPITISLDDHHVKVICEDIFRNGQIAQALKSL